MDVDDVIAQLASTEVSARRAAAESLSRGAAGRAVIPLLQACGDTDEQVQEFANSALESLGSPPLDTAPQVSEHLRQAGSVGYWAATLLGRLQADAAPWAGVLAQTLGDNPDSGVRQRAAWALGRIGPPAAVAIPELEAASQQTDARLARLATEALQKINATS